MQEGERVELTGIVQLVREPVIAALSGEPCVAHVAFARVFTQLDHLGDLIDEVELTEVAPFVLETADGPVFVVDKPTVVRVGRLPVLPHHVHAMRFLDRRGLAQYVRSSFFEDAIVRAGDTISVSGVITREPAPALEAGFRDVAMRTRLTGYGRHPLTLRRG